MMKADQAQTKAGEIEARLNLTKQIQTRAKKLESLKNLVEETANNVRQTDEILKNIDLEIADTKQKFDQGTAKRVDLNDLYLERLSYQNLRDNAEYQNKETQQLLRLEETVKASPSAQVSGATPVQEEIVISSLSEAQKEAMNRNPDILASMLRVREFEVLPKTVGGLDIQNGIGFTWVDLLTSPGYPTSNSLAQRYLNNSDNVPPGSFSAGVKVPFKYTRTEAWALYGTTVGFSLVNGALKAQRENELKDIRLKASETISEKSVAVENLWRDYLTAVKNYAAALKDKTEWDARAGASRKVTPTEYRNRSANLDIELKKLETQIADIKRTLSFEITGKTGVEVHISGFEIEDVKANPDIIVSAAPRQLVSDINQARQAMQGLGFSYGKAFTEPAVQAAKINEKIVNRMIQRIDGAMFFSSIWDRVIAGDFDYQTTPDTQNVQINRQSDEYVHTLVAGKPSFGATLLKPSDRSDRYGAKAVRDARETNAEREKNRIMGELDRLTVRYNHSLDRLETANKVYETAKAEMDIATEREGEYFTKDVNKVRSDFLAAQQELNRRYNQLEEARGELDTR